MSQKKTNVFAELFACFEDIKQKKICHVAVYYFYQGKMNCIVSTNNKQKKQLFKIPRR